MSERVLRLFFLHRKTTEAGRCQERELISVLLAATTLIISTTFTISISCRISCVRSHSTDIITLFTETSACSWIFLFHVENVSDINTCNFIHTLACTTRSCINYIKFIFPWLSLSHYHYFTITDITHPDVLEMDDRVCV